MYMLNFCIFVLPVLILSAVIIYLLFENTKLRKDEENCEGNNLIFNANKKLYSLTLDDITVKEKFEKLNEVLLETFKSKFSSVVLYDGNSYELKATNIEESLANAICDIASESSFSQNVLSNTSKYIIAEQSKDLSYKTAIERKIKSAIFSPIYYNNVYLGFWIVEDTKEHAFDLIEESDLKFIKNSINIFIENIKAQITLETAQNTDKQTGFYNNMYLYTNSRNLLNGFDESSACVICLKNIPEINEKYGRNMGNTMILRAANAIREIVSKTSIIIRYTGIRLVIITPGSNAQVTHEIMERVLYKIKNEIEYIENDKVNVDTQILIRTLKRQNNIEKELQSMMSYLDYMNAVNTIKII